MLWNINCSDYSFFTIYCTRFDFICPLQACDEEDDDKALPHFVDLSEAFDFYTSCSTTNPQQIGVSGV